MSELHLEGYDIDILVQGFPGKTVCHGGLGWSTVALLRGHGRVVLMDAGGIGMRRILIHLLAEHKLTTADVTDVCLSHAHWDHAMNWNMFPNARIHIAETELDWAYDLPDGHPLVAELYIRALHDSPQLRLVKEGAEIIPQMRAFITPGHTPGSAVYVLEGGAHDMVFTGDAAKNRSELLHRKADLTMDAEASARSIQRIMEVWQKRPGSVIVPGHDVPMVLKNGKPFHIQNRRAGLTAFLGENFEITKLFDFTAQD